MKTMHEISYHSDSPFRSCSSLKIITALLACNLLVHVVGLVQSTCRVTTTVTGLSQGVSSLPLKTSVLFINLCRYSYVVKYWLLKIVFLRKRFLCASRNELLNACFYSDVTHMHPGMCQSTCTFPDIPWCIQCTEASDAHWCNNCFCSYCWICHLSCRNLRIFDLQSSNFS